MKKLAFLCALLAVALLLARGQTPPASSLDDPRIKQQVRAADDPEIRRQMISSSVNLLNVAKFTGDVEVARALIWCDKDPDRKLADAQARSLIAKYALYLASVLRFGEQETARVMERFDLTTPDSMMLLAVDWKVEGDKATPQDVNKFDVVLRRVKLIWRLDLTPDPVPASVAAAASAIAQQAKVIQQTAEDVRANKYHNVGELAEQLKKTTAAGPTDK